MNILHMKYAVEVARAGSLNKASESLFVALPNISRSIRELEADLGIPIFERSAKGVVPTPEGEQFLTYAREILRQIDHVENMFKDNAPNKQKFSISVPRACYISEAFVNFSQSLTKDPAEIFYHETNSHRTISNILERNFNLGIIRYAEHHDASFKTMLEDKGLSFVMVAEFSYQLIMSEKHPLAEKENITFEDLKDYVEIVHADPYVPALPLAKVLKEELPDNIQRRIYIFERASQFDLLSMNHETFMWVSPTPESVLETYGLVQRTCSENQKRYRDLLIYRKGYKLTELDKQFISVLTESKQKYL